MPLLFLVLFGLGVQATFFGPLKYGILPDHLRPDELVAGNGWIEAGTFAGILTGTIAGGALILLPYGAEVVSALLLVVAACGAAAAFAVLPATPQAPGLRIDWNIVRETAALLRQARANRPVWLAILGLSWFWTLGAIFLAEFPVLVRDRFAGDPQVITLMLAMFAVGIGAGSVLTARLLRGEVSARYVPPSVILLSLFAADFAWTTWHVGPESGWHTVGAMLAHPAAWRTLLDLLGVALCGGAFSVPLYAVVQEWSEPTLRSRMIGANNVVNAGFMVLGAVVIAVLQVVGWSPPGVLGLTAAVNLLAAVITVRLLPQVVMRGLFRWYFTRLHGVRVEGLEHYRAAGPRTVVVPNHLSFLDGCLIAAFVPDQPSFAVHSAMAKAWWAQPFLAPVDVLAVDPTNPYTVRTMVRRVQDGRRLVIFPEGRITQTGSLMKIYEGAGTVADKTGADILPVRLDGLQFTPFSRMKGTLRRRLFPPLTLRFLLARRLQVPPDLLGRPRRRAVAAALQDIMVQAAFEGTDISGSLFHALTSAAQRHGPRQVIAEDIERAPITYHRLVLGAAILGRKLGGIRPARQPRRPAVAQRQRCPGRLHGHAGRRPGASHAELLRWRRGAAIRLRHSATLHRRIVARVHQAGQAGQGGGTAGKRGCGSFGWKTCGRGSAVPTNCAGCWTHARRGACRAMAFRPMRPPSCCSPAARKGSPKGVVLSHRNLRANCAQLASSIDFNPADRVLNAMPMFHAFGLTGGTLLPVLHGRPHLLLPLPAALPRGAGGRLRQRRHDRVRHRHLPDRLGPLRAPLRLPRRALCVCRCRARAG